MTEQPRAAAEPSAIRVGDLVYSKRGLYVLFFWLLVVDFSYTFMTDLLPPILAQRLKAPSDPNGVNADAFVYTLLLVTIPSLINFVLNPVVSIRSDRHRGPRGRRIPFLMVGAPMVSACLVLLGFGNEIADWIHRAIVPSVSEASVVIWTFGGLNLLYFLASMLIGTTFYYLFNDVVPESHLVSFMSWFRVVSQIAGMLFGWYVFGYTGTTAPLHLDAWGIHIHDEHFWYPKLILIGGAIAFAFVFMVALRRIREPSYPPPAPLVRGRSLAKRVATTLETLARDCFGHRIYVLFFIATMMTWMSWQMGQFTLPMQRDLGLDLDKIGKIGAATGGVSLVLTVLTAKLGDRYKPMPMMVVAWWLLVATAPVGLLYLVPGLTPQQYLWIYVAFAVTHLPVNVLMSMAESTLGMSLLPRDRYGQFCAATAMVRTLGPGIVGSMVAGWTMRVLEHRFGAYAYRFGNVWTFGFQILALASYLVLYREWKRCGGRDAYVPPGTAAAPASPQQPVAGENPFVPAA